MYNFMCIKKEKFLYANHPIRCIITGPSECGIGVFLTNLNLIISNEYEKIYIYSPSLHQDLYQKIVKWFSTYLPIHILPNILNEEDLEVVIDEIVNSKDFEKSDTEIETYESMTKSIVILDDLNQKEMDDPRVQAMFKRSRHNNLSIFIICQDYYDLSKKQYAAAMVISIIYSNQIILEMFKISIKTKLLWV